jgi:hypothetical protein
MEAFAKSTLKSLGMQLLGQGIKDEMSAISRGLSSYGFDATAEGLAVIGAAEIAVGGAMIGGYVAMNSGGGSGHGAPAAGAAAGGGSAHPAHVAGGGGSSTGGGVTYVFNVAGVAVTNAGVADSILRGIQHGQNRGIIPQFGRAA